MASIGNAAHARREAKRQEHGADELDCRHQIGGEPGCQERHRADLAEEKGGAAQMAEQNIERVRAAGFHVLDHFVLPPAAWWDDYYAPLEARMMALAPAVDPDLAAVIDETRREIALYRRHGDSYGYVFYLLRQSR